MNTRAIVFALLLSTMGCGSKEAEPTSPPISPAGESQDTPQVEQNQDGRETPAFLPRGCRFLAENGRPGNHGGAESHAWYACSDAPEGVTRHLSAQDGVQESAGRFQVGEHATATVHAEPPRDPYDRGRPLSAAVPAGTSSYVTVQTISPPPACEPCPEGYELHPHVCSCVPLPASDSTQ